MNDGASNYAFFCRTMRLRALIRGERFPEPEDEFDLVLAAVLVRLG